MSDAILVLNAGSSSLKFSVFVAGDPPRPLWRGRLEGLLTQPQFVARDAAGALVGQHKWHNTRLDHHDAIEFLFDWGRQGAFAGHHITAAGHRVAHGGMKFAQPVLIDVRVIAELEELVPLVPLHQSHNLAAIRDIATRAPELPQVACFDTSFHRSQPRLAQIFALPRRFTEEGVIRYGFHGLSYEFIVSILPGIDARAATGRTIVAHLGSGASMCAIKDGMSVATTMGFSSIDGLPMGTRSGALDPGVLLYLMRRHGMDVAALEQLLYKESGLLGVSGFSSDMRSVMASPDVRAAEAVELFVYRIGRELGSLAAALGGLDAIVFTGGIGENAPSVRAAVCRDAAWLGLQLDEAANDAGHPCISHPTSKVSAWVIPTNEELMIAQHTWRILRGDCA